MKNYKLEKRIEDYVLNPRDAILNFDLACSYHDIQQYAAALSYYLRCGELSKDKDLVYESLILAWDCIYKSGNRKLFERGQILQLIAQSPHRPEGYHLICYWLEHSEEGIVNSLTEIYNQIYSYACIGIYNKKNSIPFRNCNYSYKTIKGPSFYQNHNKKLRTHFNSFMLDFHSSKFINLLTIRNP